jgi:polar amino acid transport system substrate-binding protein
MTNTKKTTKATILSAGFLIAASALLSGCSGVTTDKPASAASDECTVPEQPKAVTVDDTPALEHQNLDEDLAALVPATHGEKLLIGVAPDVPPLFYEFEGEERGMEPDLVRAASELLGLEPVFKETNNPLQEFGAKRVDIVAGALTDTPERQEIGTFLDYVDGVVAAVVPSCNPLEIEDELDLCGKKVTAGVGTVYLTQLQDPDVPGSIVKACQEAGNRPPVAVQADSTASAFTTMSAGRADATLIEMQAAAQFIEKADGDLQVGYTYKTLAPAGTMFQPEDTDLIAAYQAAYEELHANGTYQDIMTAYGAGEGIRDTFTINLKSAP